MDYTLADNIHISKAHIRFLVAIHIGGFIWNKLHWRWLDMVLGKYSGRLITRGRNSSVSRRKEY